MQTIYTLIFSLFFAAAGNAQINWSAVTGLPAGSTFVDGQVINNFNGTGLNVRINISNISGYPKIAAADPTIVSIVSADNCTFSLTVLNGNMSLTLSDFQNLLSGEMITISNPDSKPISVVEATSNGTPRITVDGTAMTGANPSTIVGDGNVLIREGNDGAGTAFTATMNQVSGFTWRYDIAPTGTNSTEGFRMVLNAFLPVELVDFQAFANDNEQVELSWETASETDNAGFAIERSADARNWDALDFVVGKGSTQQYSTYRFIDELPGRGLQYYRLAQLDLSGEMHYSDVLAVRLEYASKPLHAWPNPAHEVLYFEADIEAGFSIFNIFGQSVTASASANAGFLDIAALPRGLYFIQAGDKRSRFVKE